MSEDKPNPAEQYNETPPTREDFANLKYIVYGVTIVMGLIVVGFVFDYWARQYSSFEDLKDQVLLQNQKIDTLTQELKK